jgi:two-component system, OmpR family, response regulator
VAGPRILVVDDNPELVTLLSSSFEEAGYAVQTAQRGRAALDIARKDRPDLAILDVLLPDLMGFDVAEALRRMRIPFIFVSGVHKGGNAAHGAVKKYGALAFFEKPFDRHALLEAVRNAVPVGPSARRRDFDIDTGPQIDEAAEAMQLTGRIELTESGVPARLRGGGPITLKPMNRDEVARLREPITRPIARDERVVARTDPGGVPFDSTAELLQPIETDGVRRGDLRDNLPHLLAAFYAAQETGELGLARGQVRKVVYFEGGMPVFAVSNLVADRLGQFLVRAGKIDENTLKQAAEEAKKSKHRTGDVLIRKGALTEGERLYYVGQQIKSILYSLFAWEEGSFQLSFQERARKETIKLDIHPANLIVRGVKKLYKPERLRRLLQPSRMLIPSQEPLFDVSDLELQPWEAHLLPRADGSRTVGELLKLSDRPENETYASLVALVSLRILDAR